VAYSQRYERAPVRPTPEPSGWTAERCSDAILWAIGVSRRQIVSAAPKPPSAAHPQIEYTVMEKSEWEATPIDCDGFMEAAERADVVLQWLRLLDDDLRTALREWAETEARGLSHKTRCRELRMLPATMTYRKALALETIAARLNRDGVPVF
jgi:hypothetical protein